MSCRLWHFGLFGRSRLGAAGPSRPGAAFARWAFALVVVLTAPALAGPLGVVPILIGPIQVLLAMLPAILVAVGGTIIALLKPSAIKAGAKVLWRNKLPAAVTATVIVGGVYLFSYAFGSGGSVVSSGMRGQQDWPVFRGQIGRRGAVADGPDPGAAGAVWSFDTEAKTFYSSPAIVGRLLYVASAEVGVFGGTGAIYCLDADTGQVIWKYSPRGFRPTYSSPSVAGRYLVCGEGLHVICDARITCLDAGSGERLWEFSTASHVESSPCLYDGKAYVGAGDDGLYCLALEGDSSGEPKVLWHLEGTAYPDCETSPVAHEGRVYFGLGEGGCAVCCVDADSGEEVWRTSAPYPVFGSPSIAGGKLFVGMGNGNLIETAEQVREKTLTRMLAEGASEAEIAAAGERLGPVGRIWALDVATGRKLWEFALDRTVLGTIAAADGRLYFGSRDGRLYCLTQDGEFVCKWDAHEPILASPAVGTDHVYFVTENGRLYALERHGLHRVWEAVAGTGGRFLSSPAVARGHVYVGTGESGLVCLGQPAETRRFVWAGDLGGPGRSGWVDASPLPKVGSFAWRYPKTAEGQSAPVIHAPAAYLDGTLYVGLDGDSGRGLVSLKLPAGSGRSRRAGPEQRWLYAAANPLYHSPAVGQDRAYFVDGRAGDPNRRLHCVNLADGKPLWTHSVAEDAPGRVLLTASRLFVLDGAETLSCFDPGGEDPGAPSAPGVTDEADRKLWSVTMPGPVGSPAAVGELVLMCSDSPPGVIALEVSDGRERWRRPLPSAPTTGPVANEDMVAVGTSDGLAVLSIVDGSPLWSSAIGAVCGPVVCDQERLACTTAASRIVVVDWSGRQHLQLGGAAAGRSGAPEMPPIPGMPPMLCGQRLLYCSPKCLVRVELDSGRTDRWRDTAWMGPITAPPILVESRAYFATGGRGLVCVGPR